MLSGPTVPWEEKRSSRVVVVAAVKPPHTMATLRILPKLTHSQEKQEERERESSNCSSGRREKMI